ncbi:MAG: carbohydrate binding domain-containing protein, partial [Rikenellaceae bacterium]|nr:carbohydrate binding domain-containing protein [Rikenellaceae bacterium]
MLAFSFAAGASEPPVFRMEVFPEQELARINPAMYGVFFEDINFGADGGLYAELIKNRSFDFPHPFTGWTPFGDVRIGTKSPCFENNPNYIRLPLEPGSLSGSGLDNEGFRGIGLHKGADYRLSFYARAAGSGPATLRFELVDSRNNNPKKIDVEINGPDWQKYSANLTSPFTDARSRLRVRLISKGKTVDVDHISLFPVDTWHERDNGMRRDLAEALCELNPGVFRFPGGCIVEGTTLETRYQWKHSVGAVENRPLNINRWMYTFQHKFFPDYFQTYGLGFYEYFLLAEDFGAEPLPVLSCGIACQYETGELVPLQELQPYIDDALDLIEFANGDAHTEWGRVRAEMGHPE